MAATALASAYAPYAILEPFLVLILDVKTEILAFLVAACAHWALFGRYSLRRVEPQRKPARCTSVSPQSPAKRRAPPAAKAAPASGPSNASLEALLRGGDRTAAGEAFKAMKSSGVADAVTFGLVIRSQVQQNDLASALKTLGAMKSAGVAASVATYNELLNCSIGNDDEASWKLVREMRAAGLKPNHVTCSILLKVARPQRAQHLDDVYELVDTVDEALDDVLLGSMVDACVRADRRDLMQWTLRRRNDSKHGFKLRTCHGYGSLIRANGYLKDLPSARAIWKELRAKKLDLSSITIGCMVEALATNGDPSGGRALIRELLDDESTRPLINAVIYCSVLKGFSHSKQFGLVWEVYEEMKREGMQLTIVTYNTLVDACARNGSMAKIPELLQAMAAQNISPTVVTYSAIIKGYCQESRLDRALEVFAEMRQSGRLKPDEHTYNTLINGCSRSQLAEKGLALLDDMVEAGVAPSNFTLSVLVKLLGRGRRPEKAFELVESLSRKFGLRPNVHVYNNLANACVQNHDLDRALNVLERMLRERQRPDARTYTVLINAAVAGGRAEEAAGLLRAAAGLRGTLPQLAGVPAALARPRENVGEEVVREALHGLQRMGRCSAGASQVDLAALRQDLCGALGLAPGALGRRGGA